jgi:molybdopterin molybdotransferase
VIPVDEALRRVLALARPLPAEPVPLAQAAGRVLAADAVAARAQPPFAASAMDGYAIQGPPQPGHVYRVTGLSRAGEASPAAVGPAMACRIFTGAPMPDGATHVVIQEDVTEEAGCITITGMPDGATNLRPAGVDFPAGFAPSGPAAAVSGRSCAAGGDERGGPALRPPPGNRGHRQRATSW